ncbi:ABC transporter ATP-binding protein [Thermaerobacillus caldiproteolyticus]|uniref:Peptide/nickel transport system ATP-binding protein n=1 Tax=Thermaerobacillus caldiproteolyticus TaxID=247480 RepID=A0A7W0BYS3_9BACL|nr:dipeptide/oligopeptide/nickel ABC transporter ATP-binding protein [Anoxybacillus caldiproteolyticus]MBA2875273.1 peptide/nickel transport system ATP-binding protein [Anoxybacillus caldiproteolyticus]QPA33165.1 ABC transporter ATP-binding protein [Anoxybacillus caldiproteolyticus]
MTNVLMARNIRKTYVSGHQAINGVSISIQKGECVGIVGESGSGKSTLARCLLMLEKLDEGEIFLHDQPLHLMTKREIRKIRHRMQAVFQHPASALNPKRKIIDSTMEVLDTYPNITPVYLQDVRDHRELCAKRLLEMVGIESRYLYCYPHELSGGQKQRIVIARAISIQPSVIIFDEPTASLDVYTQGQILTLLKELQEQLELSYLFISHDLPAVYFLSERIFVMKEGIFVDSFKKDDLFSQHRHPYTKKLVNLFEG